MSNPHEGAARIKKAEALALFLRENNLTAVEAESMTQDMWDGVAKLAKVNTPSPVTQQLTIEKLKRMEKADQFRAKA